MAFLACAALTGCDAAPDAADPAVPRFSSVPAAPSPVATARPPGVVPRTTAVPVYYVGQTDRGVRLYREFRAVATDDPASAAVRALLAGPTGTDPDYRSYWPAGTELRAPVRHADRVITVDLSEQAAVAQLGAELAELTVQQLVYTVQGALRSTDPVLILIEGRPVDQLWGHISTGQPVPRADQYRTRSLVQIDNPGHGANVGQTFEVSGEAAAFEANVPWEVVQDGSVVTRGAATAAEGQRFSAYQFTVTLPPGEYTLRVYEDDPSGGEGGKPMADTKQIQVAG